MEKQDFSKKCTNKQLAQTSVRITVLVHFFLKKQAYLLLCLFFLNLFLRLCVDILCLFFFFPLGIILCFKQLINLFYLISCIKVLAGLKAGILCSGIIIVVFFEMLRAVF